ncbi:PadR family transcriptional regulator [Lentilactobacillus diolivorans]|uniref:PadR family transcriptional regulator n=1 Tax=Lentilactobacillus diolivorans TaxID=179838 RepID=UPI00246822E8|nr:PadR family transcriptional regulator [Lentilactobacillus diolivorans]MDH5107076.1 PadR family transcriptional regulator [Lentilactobacillus diolivorans]
MNPQLKRGFLEYCILATLNQGESYGYRIIQSVQSAIDISESTLYPILKRLEKKKYIVSHNKIYNNRVRRYYRITSAGVASGKKFLKDEVKVNEMFKFIREGFYDADKK